jgi:hypothetical protein
MVLPVSHYLRLYRIRQAMARDGTTHPSIRGRAFFDQLVANLERLDPSLPCHLVHEPSSEGGKWIAFVVQGLEQARVWVAPGDEA